MARAIHETSAPADNLEWSTDGRLFAVSDLGKMTDRPYLRAEVVALQRRAKESMSNVEPVAGARPLTRPKPVVGKELEEDTVVQHAKFGRGLVVDIDGRGPSARVTVDFDGTERVTAGT